MKPAIVLLFTCEHAENKVPARYNKILAVPVSVLQSHCGYDLGAKNLCQRFSAYFKAEKFLGRVSRLLVDLNRSIYKKACFSAYAKKLSDDVQAGILETYYFSFRVTVENKIKNLLNQDKSIIVLHIAVHSFTPCLGDEKRSNTIGLLYDPKRKGEAAFARRWQQTIRAQSDSTVNVRRNYPYLGISDGHTTALRQKFSAGRYWGLELEVNQAQLDANQKTFHPALVKLLLQSLAAVVMSESV